MRRPIKAHFGPMRRRPIYPLRPPEPSLPSHSRDSSATFRRPHARDRRSPSASRPEPAVRRAVAPVSRVGSGSTAPPPVNRARSRLATTLHSTPQYSSSSYSDTSQSFHYPIPDISMQPPTRCVYEWEDPYFYTMLVQEWETTSAWTGQTWQDYKAELLKVRGLNVMSTAEYQMTSQMGVFPFVR